MNAATLKMYEHTIYQYDCMDSDLISANDNGEHIKDYWLRMLEDFPEAYDIEWYALIGVPSILNTIDWKLIARKYCERSCIIWRD